MRPGIFNLLAIAGVFFAYTITIRLALRLDLADCLLGGIANTVPVEKGGLRFSAYLPPGLADWLLGLIEKGIFHDPSEAVFVILGEHKDLEPHTDLRREILARSLQATIDDPRPSMPAEEVFKELRELRALSREPVVWEKYKPAS